MATKNVELIEIKPIYVKKTTIRVVGDTPLIMYAWSEKAKREMRNWRSGLTECKI